MPEKVIILNFSARKCGNCGAISSVIEQYHDKTNIYSYKIGEIWTPCGECDYECLRADVTCPSITDSQKEVMDAIVSADIVYYIVPNYCGFPPANFFAFNERSVGYFNLNRALMAQYMAVPKKFIIVSNTENDAFLQAMKQQAKEPNILYLKTSQYQRKSIAGDLMEVEDAKKDLLEFIASDNEHA